MRELTAREKQILTALDDKRVPRNRIAQMMGLTPEEVSRHAQQLGLEPRKYPSNLERVEMVRELKDRGMTGAEIGQKLGITASAVSKILAVGEQMEDKAWQIKKQAALGFSKQAIADKFGISIPTVNYYLRKF